MISSDNHPINHITHDEDFTVEHYRKLLQLAKSGWKIAAYQNIPWGEKFILWRHDLDCSLNRSLELAKLEQQEGMKATYFVNPHSEFYNMAEIGQYEIIRKILSFGHDLGLHFDGAFYNIESESLLGDIIEKESSYLKKTFDKQPVAFSFHNPVAAHLNCEADEYGGLVNCYSKRFKQEVSYCSDSNGYWRFNRLYDVLSESKDLCLQVLTHPGWWQDKPIPPRQRIFRSVYGRANATMRTYDKGLEQHTRLNHAGLISSLHVLRGPLPKKYELCDYLWNLEAFPTLFVELWRVHEAQINQLCKAQLRKEWRVPAAEVNALFGEDGVPIDGWRLFEALFKTKWFEATNIEEVEHKGWVTRRNQIIHGRSYIKSSVLEDGCVYLCKIFGLLANWGLKQPWAYDGLSHLGLIGLPTYKTSDGKLVESLTEGLESMPRHLRQKWFTFKQELETT